MHILNRVETPFAITMWDFSWLERRWPGAGYEDWDKALDELVERGYNAVRIEAYPNLTWIDPYKRWTLLPVWDQQVWGSPAITEVVVQPNLNNFIRKCSERDIKVALSTWFREDTEKCYLNIKTPTDLAKMWKKTLDLIDRDLIEHIICVDICNELPIKIYSPFLPEGIDRDRSHNPLQKWMRESIEELREYYPGIPYTVSTALIDTLKDEDVSFMDFMEPHIWMSSGEFYNEIGYNYERFDPVGYKNVQQYAEKLYREKPEYWKRDLKSKIDYVVKYSKEAKKSLMTTECWGITDYKDWPLLDWGWVKELCEYGTIEAASSGRWNAIATSNFCGPQFTGMWRDVEWHKRLTDIIKNSKIDKELVGGY